MPKKEKLRKKRLFWCCILRDRILPLGVRRSIYITNAHFNFSKNTPLTARDLQDEITGSRVYAPQAKQSLAELVARLCELAVILTDVIMLLYPVDELPPASSSSADDALPISKQNSLIEKAKSDLTRWYEGAVVKFPTPAGIGDAHESVALYTNLMYLYYQ